MKDVSGKILVVEDDEVLRSAIAYKLKNAGYIVTRANDGNEALSMLAKDDYDLVVLDLKMPILDGFKFLKELKNLKIKKRAKIIAFSNLGAKSDQDLAIELGADISLLKVETTLTDLVQKIDQMMKKSPETR